MVRSPVFNPTKYTKNPVIITDTAHDTSKRNNPEN
jgi:hypothetical protein